eukprot:766978-Hanusia_phi.AAC.4
MSNREGSLSRTYTYVEPVVTGLNVSNFPTTGGIPTLVYGELFGSGLSFLVGLDVGLVDWTARARLGSTSCEWTDWISETALVCSIPSGSSLDPTIDLTLVGIRTTAQLALTFDTASLASVSRGNMIHDADISLAFTVTGSDMIKYDATSSSRITFSASQSTKWISDTSIKSTPFVSFGRSSYFVLSMESASSTITEALSYDSQQTSVFLNETQGNIGPPNLAILFAPTSLEAYTIGFAIANTATEATEWLSTISIQVKISRGAKSSLSFLATIESIVGSINDAFSFDSTSLSHVIGYNTHQALRAITYLGSNQVSASMRSDSTACEETLWESDTSLFCKSMLGVGQSQRVAVTVSDVGTLTEVLSNDPPSIVQVAPGNTWSSLASSNTILTINLEGGRPGYTLKARVAGTQAELTSWDSVSSVMCQASAGSGSTKAVALTSGQTVATTSESFTYDSPDLRSIENRTITTEGGQFLTFFGSQFVAFDVSPAVAVEFTVCELTRWISDSSVIGKVASGISLNLNIRITLEERISDLTLSFTYSNPLLSSLKVVNAPALGSSSMTIFGTSFGSYDYSQKMRVGGTDCLASSWIDMISIACKIPGGSGTGKDVALTSGVQVGSLSLAFTYNIPSIGGTFPHNIPTTGHVNISIFGGEFGNSASDQRVTINDRECYQTTYVSDTQLTCQSPEGIGKAAKIKVYVSGQEGIGLGFLSYDAPSLSSISRGNYPTTGNVSFTIFGSGFSTFDHASANLSTASDLGSSKSTQSTYISDSSLSLYIPRGVGNLQQIALTILSQVGTISYVFSYDKPSISSISKQNSATTGGINITVHGFNLGDGFDTRVGASILSGHSDPGSTLVNDYIGTVIGVSSFSELLLRVPPGAGKDKSVAITVALQESEDSGNVPLFSYDAPKVSTVVRNYADSTGGTTLTITGSDFGPGLPPLGGPVTVSIEDATKYPGECSSVFAGSNPHTTLLCVVPPGSGTNLNVTVGIDGQYGVGIGLFSYKAPVVLFVSPNFGNTTGSDTITIRGTNFGVEDPSPSVTIGQTSCQTVNWLSDSSLDCTVAQGAGYALTVQVVNRGQSGSRPNSFSYKAPVVVRISPSSGDTFGGTNTTITGSNFGTQEYSLQNKIGTQVCKSSHYFSDTSVTCETPVGAGSQWVYVQVAGQTSAANVAFIYFTPVISSVYPLNGPVTGGTYITILGRYFGPINFSPVAYIGFTVGAVNIWTSDSSIQTQTKAGKNTKLDVRVRITGTSGVPVAGSLTQVWSYDIPSVTSPTTSNGPTSGSSTITLFGKNLVQPAVLTIGSTTAQTVNYVSATSINFLLPPGVGLQNYIQGVFAGEDGASSTYVNYDAPVLNSLSPWNAPTRGGSIITLTGLNFGPANAVTVTNVTVAQNLCTNIVSVVEHLKVSCSIPAGTGSDKAVGITVAQQSSSQARTFTYDSPAATLMLPNYGSTNSTTTVTVYGANFGLEAVSQIVTIGDSSCTPTTYTSDSSLSCIASPGLGASLTVSVQVLNLKGETKNLFSYYAPIITDASPRNAPAATSKTVTILGSHFGIYDSTGKARIDVSFCLSTSWISDSSLRCKSPLNVGQDKSVYLSIQGQYNVANTYFTYDLQYLTSLNPARAPTTASTAGSITLQGVNFGPTDSSASIRFGNTKAVQQRWTSDSQVLAVPPDGQGKDLSVSINIASRTMTLATSFSYDAPAITSIVYSSAPTSGGTEVTIFGRNFGLSSAARSVTIGATTCPAVTYISHIVMKVTTPAGAGKQLQVVVQVEGQTGIYSNCGLSECKFSYSAPAITATAPKYGPSAGGTVLTIYGTNFGSGADIEATVNSIPCAATTYVTSNSVTCSLPANIYSANSAIGCSQCNALDVSVSLSVANQSNTLPAAFSFTRDGSSQALAGLWCKAIKVAYSVSASGIVWIDPDGDVSTNNAFQVYCLNDQDEGGWTKVVQYTTQAYTANASAYGSIATSDVQDGKLSDANINLIGGLRGLVNTGTISTLVSQSVLVLTDLVDSLELVKVSGYYTGFSLQVGQETRLITACSLTTSGAVQLTCSPAFTSAAQGETYSIYSRMKEYLIFGLYLANTNTPIVYRLYLRSSSEYQDTAPGLGIASGMLTQGIAACYETDYSSCASAWSYSLSQDYIDTNALNFPNGAPGTADDCDRLFTGKGGSLCFGHFEDGNVFVGASTTQRCYTTGVCDNAIRSFCLHKRHTMKLKQRGYMTR